MLFVGFSDTKITPDLARLLDEGVGGVILFEHNVQGPEHVAELNDAVRRHAGRPLLICVDQEGGTVARLRNGFTPMPPARELGRAGPAAARETGRVCGTELAAVGFDLNFAPVLDVDTNPANPIIGDRSFSSDAARAAEAAVAFAAGLAEAGVVACGKHFPGHGDTLTDSHLTLPRLPHDMDRLEAVELVPFRAAIAAGIPAIMSAHIVFEAIDPAVPGTMSRRVVQGLLRETLGFQGVIFSDDLEMDAVKAHFDFAGAVKQTAEAGVDALLVCHHPELQWLALESLRTLPQERVAASVGRIAALHHRPAPPPCTTAPAHRP